MDAVGLLGRHRSRRVVNSPYSLPPCSSEYGWQPRGCALRAPLKQLHTSGLGRPWQPSYWYTQKSQHWTTWTNLFLLSFALSFSRTCCLWEACMFTTHTLGRVSRRSSKSSTQTADDPNALELAVVRLGRLDILRNSSWTFVRGCATETMKGLPPPIRSTETFRAGPSTVMIRPTCIGGVVLATSPSWGRVLLGSDELGRGRAREYIADGQESG